MEAYAFKVFGQTTYGQDSYSTGSYSCGSEVCTTESAPNTGFLGTSDMVWSTASGALLVAVAIVGVAAVIISRVRRRKQQGSK